MTIESSTRIRATRSARDRDLMAAEARRFSTPRGRGDGHRNSVAAITANADWEQNDRHNDYVPDGEPELAFQILDSRVNDGRL